MSTENYKVEAFCKNCDFGGEAEILKGTSIEQASCPKCGTKNLEKKLPKVRLTPHTESYH